MNVQPIIAFIRLAGGVGKLRALGVMARRALARRSGAHDRIAALRFKCLAHPVHLRIASSDWEVMDQVLLRRDYAEPAPHHAGRLRAPYRAMLDAGKVPVIIDAGANIGLASAWYASRFPDAAILALEPVGPSFDLLCRNAAPYSGIRPIRAALSARAGSLALRNDTPGQDWDAWRTVPASEGADETVPALTVDDLLRSVPNGELLIAKIDIEGHEADLFAQNTGWVAAAPLIVMELHDWLIADGHAGHAVFACLTRSGVRDYVQGGDNMFAYSCHVPAAGTTA